MSCTLNCVLACAAGSVLTCTGYGIDLARRLSSRAPEVVREASKPCIRAAFLQGMVGVDIL